MPKKGKLSRGYRCFDFEWSRQFVWSRRVIVRADCVAARDIWNSVVRATVTNRLIGHDFAERKSLGWSDFNLAMAVNAAQWLLRGKSLAFGKQAIC